MYESLLNININIYTLRINYDVRFYMKCQIITRKIMIKDIKFTDEK